MASRYDENTKARAVRLLREHAGDYETEWVAIKAISALLGWSADGLPPKSWRHSLCCLMLPPTG
jgi:transposase